METPTAPIAHQERRGPGRDRRRTIVDDLHSKMRAGGESFWTLVRPMFLNREITREQVRELIRRGLAEARGNYRIVLRLFNMPESDYKRFLNFLRKHDCQLPFMEFRQGSVTNSSSGERF